MSDSEELIICPVPSLVATLLNRERAKGSPLTEPEVIQIRDACPSVALRPEQVRKIEESRGYTDIDPENCWEEWQEARKHLRNETPEMPDQKRQGTSVCVTLSPGRQATGATS